MKYPMMSRANVMSMTRYTGEPFPVIYLYKSPADARTYATMMNREELVTDITDKELEHMAILDAAIEDGRANIENVGFVFDYGAYRKYELYGLSNRDA